MGLTDAMHHSGAILGTSISRPSHTFLNLGSFKKRLGKHQAVTRCLLAGHSYTSTHPKVAVFVEPSPFSHVSGMKIRFSNLIKELRQLGSEVTVFTPCVDPPESYCGAKVSPTAERPRQLSDQTQYDVLP